MKKRVIKKIILFFVLMTMFILNTKTYAAGSFSISASNTTINKDESITLSIKGNNAYGKVNITATNATLSASSVFLQNDTQTVTIKSNSTEDIKITVSPDASGLGDIDENPITASQSMTIKVNKPTSEGQTTATTTTTQTTPTTTTPTTSTSTSTTTEKSNIATLSNLGIKPNDFSGFSPSKTSYSVTVPNEVESVEVYASKGQSGQKITGTGVKTLAEGENTVNVVVTAEDGTTTKTYTINITRDKEEQEEKEEEKTDETETETFGLAELKIDNIELQPQFQTDIYEYKADLTENIEKFNITTLATEANASVEITGNENLQEGENIITIIVKDQNEEKTAAYQIIVNKKIEEEQSTTDQEEQQQEKIKRIVIVVGIDVLIIIFIIIIVKIKKSKEKKDIYMPYGNIINNYNEDEPEEITDAEML